MRGLAVRGAVQARLSARRNWLVAVFSFVFLATGALAVSSPGAVGVDAVVNLASLAVFLGLTGGWLGDELASGAAIFWLQTTRSPVVLYGARFAAVAATAVLVAAAVPTVAAGLLWLAGYPSAAHEQLRSIPGMWSAFAFLAVLIWGTGGWGIRGDTWAAPALFLALTVLGAAESALDLGPLAGIARVVGLPLEATGQIESAVRGGEFDPAAFVKLAAWIGAWLAIGGVGLAVRSRRAALVGGEG